MSFDNASDKALIPTKYHPDVEHLLAYLQYFPFETPTCCPYCNSPNLLRTGVQKRPELDLTRYRCGLCQKNFTQLSNTLFNRSDALSTWGEVGKLYLAGHAKSHIVKQLGISQTMVEYRCHRINRYMQQHYPKLYQWWDNHQQRDDRSFSDIVRQQAITFLDWLHETITRRTYNCRQCQHPMLKFSQTDLRPLFVCNRCRRYYNALGNTRLKGLPQIHYWLPYAKMLIEGHSCMDIEREIKVKHTSTQKWRKVFIAQMQDMGLNQLVQWLEWQRKRRCVQVLRINLWGDGYQPKWIP